MKKSIIILVSILAIGFTASAQTYNLYGSLNITDTTKTTDLKVNQDLIVKEDAKLKGGVTIDVLKPDPTATCGKYMVTVDDNGKLQKTTFDIWLQTLYPNCSDCVGGVPVWSTTEPGEVHIGSDCNSVHIGIGTYFPAVELDVKGQGRFTKEVGVGAMPHDDVRLLVKPNAGDAVGVCLDATGQTGFKYGFKVLNGSANYKAFSISNPANNLDNLRIMGDGNIFATSVFVRLPNDFPDYVFEDDYDLMSLSDLQAYITANKRLPKMPSADKVAQDGLDLGETDRLLTEKVEELTLYVLQLKKELDALKQENQILKETLDK